MRYKSFRIQNFKGIKDTTVNLQSAGGAAIFALVGLNESGKTTILEAIHSFSPDGATGELLGGKGGKGVPITERVPRHLISTFTGKVSVTATLSVSMEDKQEIAKILHSDQKRFRLNPASLPSEVVIEQSDIFTDGDLQENTFELLSSAKVKTAKATNWRNPTAKEQDEILYAIYQLAPDIAYFPTFVFDFPEKIFLTERGDEVDGFYRQVFQDILDFDGQRHTIEKDIVRRVRAESLNVPWLSFVTAWAQHADRRKIQHVMDRASAAVTKLVFGRWNRIFGEDTKGKEIDISFETAAGEAEDEKGSRIETNEHDLFIKFQIRDGTRRFNVNDRSLGFRWFFAFMLFTQFRVARSDSDRPLLFLFDEPASNLHAAAQQKLIECFQGIAQKEHALIYSTHSHYMVEPKWLEQTFIVTNRADAPISSVVDEISLDDDSLDVQVTPYRAFVNQHPNQTSYFQPILDRLEVVPSRFDIRQASVILEGKSDYYVLRYAAQAIGRTELQLIPGLGAGTFGALIALHIGWNLNCLFIVDGDEQGKKEKARYVSDYGVSPERIATLDELLKDVKEIEDILDDVAIEKIRKDFGLNSSPTKNQIRRYFQERLASDKVDRLSAHFSSQSVALLDQIRARLKE